MVYDTWYNHPLQVHSNLLIIVTVVTVVSFTLMGIEGIADEIEMPFGTDYYDIPMDHLCNGIRGEAE